MGVEADADVELTDEGVGGWRGRNIVRISRAVASLAPWRWLSPRLQLSTSPPFYTCTHRIPPVVRYSSRIVQNIFAIDNQSLQEYKTNVWIGRQLSQSPTCHQPRT